MPADRSGDTAQKAEVKRLMEKLLKDEDPAVLRMEEFPPGCRNTPSLYDTHYGSGKSCRIWKRLQERVEECVQCLLYEFCQRPSAST